MNKDLMLLHKKISISGTEIFYRTAGKPEHPAILLLHGFPSSSVMFKSLMLSLSERFYLVAPDYPGFGFSSFPDPEKFDYTFANMANCMESFVNELGLKRFSIYLHDYGCPIGLRLCLKMPERIESIIVQNGNAYQEGLGPQWDETKDYWENPTPEKEKKIAAFLSEEGTRDQYFKGLPEDLKETVGPELYTLDWLIMSQPKRVSMQLALNTDYRDNVRMYPEFQQYFREHKPPALILWGKYDPFFSLEEAYCFQRDFLQAEIHILEGGHMALETNFYEVRALLYDFLSRISQGEAQ